MSETKAKNSSDAIVDSLFNEIASGNLYFDGTENLLTTVTTTTAGKIVDDSTADQPSTSCSKVDASNIIISANLKESIFEKPSFSFSPTKRKKTSSKGHRPIKIISLKETTKSKIIDANINRIDSSKKNGKFGEEGEILPSDVEDDTQSIGHEFDVISETDGELTASDHGQDKSTTKKRSKKKKKKHKKHSSHEKKKEKKLKKEDRKSRHEKKLEHSPKRLDEEKIQEIEQQPNRDQDLPPWKNMLNFHLNRRPNYDSRSNLSSRYRRESSYSNFVSRPSFRNGRSRSPVGSTSRNYDSRRRDYPPPNNSRSFYANGQRNSDQIRSGRGTGRNFHQERIPQRRATRSRSRSRSKHRSTSKERTSQPRIGTPDKKTEEKLLSIESKSIDDGPIDKKKLYEIARRNAAVMLKAGAWKHHLNEMSTEDLMKLRSGGKSMEELIAYCKKIQKREEKRDVDASSSDEGETKKDEDDGDELDAFVRHPFLIKQQSTSGFVFNVKNVIQLPVKTPAERAADDSKLRITFPVSSGEQHRNNPEPEWTPVVPPTAEKPAKTKESKASKTNTNDTMLALPPPPSPPVMPIILPPPPPPPIEPPIPQAPMDIGEVVSTRLKAIRRLNDNANDVEAMKLFHFAEEQMKKWAESKNIPGLFIGSTGVSVLTPEQLAPSDIRMHAWAKKDLLINAKPVASGVGMKLMEKMGWKPGEGLGKNREGTLEPLTLEIKSDRKGLLTSEEGPTQRIRSSNVNMKDFQGKHPVSALMELCSKRRWSLPDFSCVESGPSHDRQFTWKALVNGVEYQAATPTGNKKSGKAQVCQIVLQSLGLVPRDKKLPVVIG